ncbi:helix-turn-helix domain-containing protein [Streptantibioticus ferralitis]|uniref:helix-turn-helix domain-containing protein n=1 Tax=Streptantibioticus ferralitis TaxID=236510 RepID=UPI003555F73E
MGRREKPIGACSKSLAALASWLRARRESAGLSYARLAELTPYSEDTLARAASGRYVPRLVVVRAFAEACDADLAEAERLWKRARYETHPNEERAKLRAVHVDIVGNFTELRVALVDVHAKDGRRPYRQLNEEAGGFGRLPAATISRVLNGQVIPSRDFVITFARVCGARGSALEAWGRAWDRADAARRPSDNNPSSSNCLQRERHHLDAARAQPPAGQGAQFLLHSSIGGGKTYSAIAGLSRVLSNAEHGRRPGIPCVACGYLVRTHSDMGARMGGCVWCIACAGSLQLNASLINHARRRPDLRPTPESDHLGQVSSTEDGQARPENTSSWGG